MRTLRPSLVTGLLLLSTAATGCLSDEFDLSDLRDTAPKSRELAVDVPAANKAADKDTSDIGSVSEFYRITRNTSDYLNGATAFWVGLIRTIMAYPPSEVDGDVVTWGPWRDQSALRPLEYQLVAERVGERSITYTLSARNKNGEGDFLPLIEGTARRPGAGQPGSGTLKLLFDNQSVLEPAKREQGTIDIAYDLEGEPKTNHIEFIDFVNEQGEGPLDAEYDYALSADGAGRFDFLTAADVDRDAASLPESLHIVSRWNSTGAGQSDVAAWGGSLDGATWAAAQCWDTAFLTTYNRYRSEGGSVPVDLDEGDAATCPFEPETVTPVL
jgi:hypothetical protein